MARRPVRERGWRGARHAEYGRGVLPAAAQRPGAGAPAQMPPGWVEGQRRAAELFEKARKEPSAREAIAKDNAIGRIIEARAKLGEQTPGNLELERLFSSDINLLVKEADALERRIEGRESSGEEGLRALRGEKLLREEVPPDMVQRRLNLFKRIAEARNALGVPLTRGEQARLQHEAEESLADKAEKLERIANKMTIETSEEEAGEHDVELPAEELRRHEHLAGAKERLKRFYAARQRPVDEKAFRRQLEDEVREQRREVEGLLSERDALLKQLEAFHPGAIRGGPGFLGGLKRRATQIDIKRDFRDMPLDKQVPYLMKFNEVLRRTIAREGVPSAVRQANALKELVEKHAREAAEAARREAERKEALEKGDIIGDIIDARVTVAGEKGRAPSADEVMKLFENKVEALNRIRRLVQAQARKAEQIRLAELERKAAEERRAREIEEARALDKAELERSNIRIMAKGDVVQEIIELRSKAGAPLNEMDQVMLFAKEIDELSKMRAEAEGAAKAKTAAERVKALVKRANQICAERGIRLLPDIEQSLSKGGKPVKALEAFIEEYGKPATESEAERKRREQAEQQRGYLIGAIKDYWASIGKPLSPEKAEELNGLRLTELMRKIPASKVNLGEFRERQQLVGEIEAVRALIKPLSSSEKAELNGLPLKELRKKLEQAREEFTAELSADTVISR